MEDPGFLTRIDSRLAGSNLEGFLKESQKSGCSWFFIASAVISLITNGKNRRNTLAQLEEDERFQEHLQKAKERYKDEKEAKERAFKALLKQRQREFHREEAAARMERDLDNMELRQFFKDWPLKTSIKAIYDGRKKYPVDDCPLNIIIGKHTAYHPSGDSMLSYEAQYNGIIDSVQNEIKEFGIEATNLFRFCEKNSITGGPAVAYIYAMMSTMPCVVIMPNENHIDKTLSINVSLWTQDALFPYHRSLFTLEYNEAKAIHDKEYFQKKKRELISHYTAICGVFNDIYMLIEKQVKPRFCEYTDLTGLFADYPQLKDFTIKEYSSLVSDENIEESTGIDIMSEIVGKEEGGFINAAIKKALNKIK